MAQQFFQSSLFDDLPLYGISTDESIRKAILSLLAKTEVLKLKNSRLHQPSQDKIDDYGEKILGARKDLLRELGIMFNNINEKTLAENTFSKVFRLPDIKKLVSTGVLSEDNARKVYALSKMFYTKPRVAKSTWYSKRKLEEWVNDTMKIINAIKMIFDGDEAYKTTYDELQTNWWEDALKTLGWNPGDNVVVPFNRIHYVNVNGYYVSFCKPNGDHFGVNLEPPAKISDEIAFYAALSQVSEDTLIPIKKFRIYPVLRTATREPTGRWTWGAVKTKIFRTYDAVAYSERLSEEDAQKWFAEIQKRHPKTELRLVPYDEETRIVGYSNFSIEIVDVARKRYSVEVAATTADEAKAYLESHYDEVNQSIVALILKNTKSTRASQPEDYFEEVYTTDRDYIVSFKKVPYLIMAGPYKNHAEAKDWINQNAKRVYEEYQKRKKIDTDGFQTNSERSNKDYLKGRHISPQEFCQTFGFRGVQFGNWANQNERQVALDNAFNAFMDIADLLSLKTKAVSLFGTLGIAFGSRGTGWANAHYEQKEVVINLTKTRGAGCLGHEWWHALDHYFGRSGGNTYGMLTEGLRTAGCRQQIKTAYEQLVTAIAASPYSTRSLAHGATYWGSVVEMTARLFEVFLYYEFREKGINSPFLQGKDFEALEKRYREISYNFFVFSHKDEKNLPSYEAFTKTDVSIFAYPYPTLDDIKSFVPILRNLFASIVQEEVDGKVRLSGNSNTEKNI